MAIKIETMKGKKTIIPFGGCFYEATEPLNESFEKGVLRVAYVGQNRNNTFISKNTFENAIPTIYNCPIVANYMRDKDEIGSHDSELVERNGEYEFVNITEPVGVVPESAKYWWENIEEQDGKVHEYLCTEVILWKRQECYRKIKENGITSESMEISVNQGKWVDGCYHIDNMTFLAFCLLGTAEPCFESASLEVFNKSNQDFKCEFAKMLEELKQFSQIKSEETKQMDKNEILSQFNLTVDALLEAGFELDFDVIDASELESMCKKYTEAQSSNDTGDDEGNNNDTPTDGDNSDNSEDANFSLTIETMLEEIHNAIRTETFTDDWGWESYRYCYVDVQDSEIIVYDRKDNWNLYGIPYSMNGDNIVADFECKKRKKVNYADFDGGVEQNPIAEYVTQFATYMDEKVKNAETELSKAEKKFNEVEQKYTDIKHQQLKEQLTKIFNKFDTKLADCKEYLEYKEHALDTLDTTVEAVETYCYACVGKLNMQFNIKETQNHQGIKLSVDTSNYEDNNSKAPYGGIFEK